MVFPKNCLHIDIDKIYRRSRTGYAKLSMFLFFSANNAADRGMKFEINIPGA